VRLMVTILALLLTTPAVAGVGMTLPNGLHVVLEADDRQPWASVVLCYDAGTRDEQAGEFEYAHLFEHLMFGRSEHAPHSFSEEMRQLGGTENAFTYVDRTCYETAVPSPDLPRVLWFEADRMHALAGALEQKDLDEQRAVVKAEILQRTVDKPISQAIERLHRRLHPGSGYSHPAADRLADLDAATLEQVRAWHEARYVPGRAWLAVVGDFDPAETLGWIQQTLGAVPEAAPAPRIRPREAGPISTRVDRVDRGLDRHDTMLFAWRSAAAGTEDDAALELAAQALMHHESELREELNEGGGLLGVSAWQNGYDHAGLFFVSVAHDGSASQRSIARKVLAAVSDLGEFGPSANQVRAARNSWAYEGLRQRGDPMERARRLLLAWSRRGDPKAADTAVHDAIKPPAIQDAVYRWLVPANGALVVVTNRELETHLEKAMR
jgi:zinc protease